MREGLGVCVSLSARVGSIEDNRMGGFVPFAFCLRLRERERGRFLIKGFLVLVAFRWYSYRSFVPFFKLSPNLSANIRFYLHRTKAAVNQTIKTLNLEVSPPPSGLRLFLFRSNQTG